MTVILSTYARHLVLLLIVLMSVWFYLFILFIIFVHPITCRLK